MAPRKAIQYAGLFMGVMVALGTGAGSCDAIRGKKANGATEESEPPGFAALGATCPGSEYYADAETALQVKCAACHGPGGTGAGKYTFNVGNSLTDQQLGDNYIQAYKRLDLTGDGGSDYTQNALLSNPLGGPGHPTVMSVFDGEFASIYSWIDAEVNTPCTSDIVGSN